MRFDADKVARGAGIRNALILVRESWGAEVMVRLWAVGVPRADAEEMYHRIDTCVLDQAILTLEAEGVRDSTAVGRLRPLLADSARVTRSGLSPDPTERALPGANYPERCLRRIRDDWEGFTLFAPFLLAGADGNRYVRDLRERNALLADSLRDRPTYLLRPRGYQVGLPPEFRRVPADSILQEGERNP